MGPVSTANWFALYTSSRHEKRVQGLLQQRDMESYLPLYSSERQWKNRCKVALSLPLFPNYVFVRMQKEQRIHILQIPGVIGIVGSGRDPLPLPEFEIESLRTGLHHRKYSPHSYLTVGDRVRIKQGAMEGLNGILLRSNQSTRVVLSIDFIQRSVAVEVDVNDIEPLGSLAA